MVKSASGKSGMRSFTVVEVHDQKGNVDKQATKKAAEMRLVGRTHRSAASKTLSAMCRYKKVKGTCVMTVKVKETTQGSDGKERIYKCRRVKLAKPLVVGKGDTARTIEYTNVVTAVKGSNKTAKKSMGKKRTMKRRS